MKEIDQIPKLPEKLPPESRIKLSIIYRNNDSYSKSSKSSVCSQESCDTAEENNYYKGPVEQPTFSDNLSSSNDQISFFNDSIYIPIEIPKEHESEEIYNTQSVENYSYFNLKDLGSNEKMQEDFQRLEVSETLDKFEEDVIGDKAGASSSVSENSILCAEEHSPTPPIPRNGLREFYHSAQYH